MDPAAFRVLFPVLRRQVWLATPSQAPGSVPVAAALRAAVGQWMDGDREWPAYDEQAQRTRGQIAALLGLGAAGDVALLQSVAEAAATVAGGLWWTWLAGPVLLPFALGGAVVAYRALGHTVTGDHLVVRSGLVSRRTVALRGRAVVGWRIRQSVFQRRLGLATLTAATAAGTGQYEAVDLRAADAVDVAERAAPGLLTPFAAAGPAPAETPPILDLSRSTSGKSLR